jgi:ABC-type lipoprotein release transport system permease subunit
MTRRLLQIAWRNLWRNPRRTLITMAAIALGYAMLLLFASLLAGLTQQMIDNGTRLSLSHIQVHAPGYAPDRSIYKTLGGRAGTDVKRLLAAITADARVQAAAPRVYGYGLASSTQHSAGTEILGVVPDQEQRVTRLHARLVKGTYLSTQTPKGVVVGEKLAQAIGVDIDAEMILVTQAADGSLGNDLFTVVGIFRTGLEALDRGLVLMPLSALQELLSLAPGRIHEVGVVIADAAGATAVAAELEHRLSEIIPVRVQGWPALAPDLAEYVRLSCSNSTVLFFIVFLVAVIGIMNTMLMAVFERTHELGVLMALGMRPVQVIGLIIAEAGGLAVASLVLGGVLGAPLLWYLQVQGLDLRSVMGELSLAGVVVDPIWYGWHDFAVYGRAAVGLACTALISALYPALRAARFRPVEAIRKV